MSFEFKYNYPQIARDSGFKLRQFRDGPLDWRLVASLEVEHILRDQQFEHIDAILYYLSEAPLASMLESNILDSGIAKYFILSQLALQYLIFCRKFLDETVRTLRESLAHKEVENLNLKKVNQEHSNEILKLHKQISQIEVINDVVFPCHICTKNFISNDALNMHLIKKHSKIQTAEIQCKNDRTLINTIKLELEIKQLKQRLNIAEKDIRERAESKKGSPREVTKTYPSTQISAVTIDKSTQSNFIESKENDCTGSVKDFDIFSQIQEKISHLEVCQETQSTGNQHSINEITQKLSEIMKCLQKRSEQDTENLNKFVKDVLSSSVSFKQLLATPSADELEAILLNTVKNVMHLNSTKLNEILTKIEAICEEKFPSLEVEIKKGRLMAQQSIKTALSPPVLEIAFPSNNDENPREHVSHSQERLLTQQQIKTKSSLPLTLSASSSNNGTQPFKGKECITPYSKVTYSIERNSQEIESNGNETDVSQEILDSEENISGSVPFETMQATKKDTSLLKELTLCVDKKMSSFGINFATKTLSASKMADITAHLSDKRTSLKEIYPRFYATRNKLKNIVDGLTNKQMSGQLLTIVANNNIESVSIARPNNLPLNCSKDELNINDTFKMRLEKMLSSPIKKPNAYVKNRKDELRKPIPLPRKRVMFHNADQTSEILPALQSKT